MMPIKLCPICSLPVELHDGHLGADGRVVREIGGNVFVGGIGSVPCDPGLTDSPLRKRAEEAEAEVERLVSQRGAYRRALLAANRRRHEASEASVMGRCSECGRAVARSERHFAGAGAIRCYDCGAGAGLRGMP